MKKESNRTWQELKSLHSVGMTVQELIDSLQQLIEEKQITPDQNICIGLPYDNPEGEKVKAEYFTTDEDNVFIA